MVSRFKLHLVVNENKEIVSHNITTASIHDSNMLNKDGLLKDINGELIGDKGYIGEEKKKKLASQGINLFTPLRDNMDQSKSDYTRRHKRIRKKVETTFGVTKDHFCLLYKFARNVDGFFSWVRAGLLAYSFSMLFENEEKLDTFMKCLISQC